jgi:hypothetical protein
MNPFAGLSHTKRSVHDYTFKNRKNTHATIIISECKTECKQRPSVYDTDSSGKMEFFMCPYHSHAAPTQPEKEPRVGIGIIK